MEFLVKNWTRLQSYGFKWKENRMLNYYETEPIITNNVTTSLIVYAENVLFFEKGILKVIVSNVDSLNKLRREIAELSEDDPLAEVYRAEDVEDYCCVDTAVPNEVLDILCDMLLDGVIERVK